MVRKGDLIIHGDVFAGLDLLQDESVAVAVTSPPYWRQRDYGFQGQIGQEDAPEDYIGRLVRIFNKLKRKMREDGVFFLNVGDKYLHRYGKSHLLQIPYRLAYHMMKDGWQLEDIIIWYKLNYMPSSVKDRFTNTYEPVLVFSRGSDSIYRKGGGKGRGKNVVKIRLQQTPWRHTAVFPEKLVEKLLERVELDEGDLILDPFAGTGTVGAVVRKLRGNSLPSSVTSILIEKGDQFIDIIRERTLISDVERVEDKPYIWEAVKERDLPEVEPHVVAKDRHGEVYIADSSQDFLSALRGITTEDFKEFHRKDALYFFGVKNWTIEDLYYVHAIIREGYVLRNMIVASNGSRWFPIFMFALDSTRLAYRFYLDRVRIRPKNLGNRDWSREEFLGLRVRDLSGKRIREGKVVRIIKKYPDGFPKIVAVRWDDGSSLEFVLHPEKDEILMEGLAFRCPRCGHRLEDPYDPASDNICPRCSKPLWTDISTVPSIEEPKEVVEAMEEIRSLNYDLNDGIVELRNIDGRKLNRSKFAGMDRLNWGASPGARKLMIGEYFTKMRLYRIDQPMIARYLNLLRRARGMTIKDVIEALPPGYMHTAGHWFRQDFGGSIPVPDDLPLLRKVLGMEDGIFEVLRRTALKFQTVRAFPKGRNPGDFLEYPDLTYLKNYLRKLYMPPAEYLRYVG